MAKVEIISNPVICKPEVCVEFKTYNMKYISGWIAYKEPNTKKTKCTFLILFHVGSQIVC